MNSEHVSEETGFAMQPQH